MPQESKKKPVPILDPELSLAKALFLGEIDEPNLHPFPAIRSEESEILRMVIDSVDKFMSPKDAQFREYDKLAEQPKAYLDALKEQGLFGLIVAEQYGGIGLSNLGYSRVLQQTSRYDPSTSLTIGAHSSIGMKGVILFGTDEQKKKYLPKLASGELIAAFCLTEPGSGSDAASIKTSASKNPDGTWTLSGEKIWISNGSFAGLFTVFARTEGEEGKLTAFIVERDFGGVSTGPKEDKMGIRASSTTSVLFDKVKLPSDAVLGEEGKGFKVAMSILNSGRTGLGGGSIGGMKRVIQLASAQASQRKQFGTSISEFGLIKEKIAQMTVNCFATESVVTMVGHYIDSGVEDYSVEAAISKVYATEALWVTVNEGLQIAGGNGYMKEYPYERFVRDSRINMIFEGTNEILRLYIALSGMKDAGVYLKDLGKGVSKIFNDPIKGFGLLSGYATKRFAQLTSVGRAKLSFVPPILREDAKIFEEGTLEFARAVELILRRHGKEIIGKQFAMKRIANLAIDLVVGLCVVSRVSRMIEQKSVSGCEQEIAISHIFSQQARRRMKQNHKDIERNEDELMKGLSDFIVKSGGYPWDIF